jgi:CspA family cold shock protein
MLKAMRNFVRQRSRHAQQQIWPQVVEDDDMENLRSHSKVPLHLAEPPLEEPSGQPVWGRMKWHDPDKRYGFVELSDGSGDVFLQTTALAGIGMSSLQPGETLEVRVAPGQRGPQVTEVISVDSSTATPPGSRRKSFRSRSDLRPTEARVQEIGMVKWYNAAKGFGFIVLDDSGKDVFVHASALKRAGIVNLNEGQRVYVGIAEVRKGPEAASIQIAY